MRIPIIGGGPAGLMAADTLLSEGFAVDIYDAMPSFGRKFLMAGKSGLNISNAEPEADFLARYPDADTRLLDSVRAFGSENVIAFMSRHQIKAHIGSSGRIFPDMMKASPLLRAWLGDLTARGARLYPRHRWAGWDTHGNNMFVTPEHPANTPFTPPNTRRAPSLFALGGASWKRLGSDGAWATHFDKAGIELRPFHPSNCGFRRDWSDYILSRFEGEPVKSIALCSGDQTTRSEFVITRRGVESGGIYTLSANLRRQLRAHGKALIHVDLLPDTSTDAVAKLVAKPRGKQSLSKHLRKTLRLSPVKLALLRELAPQAKTDDASALASTLKALPLELTDMAPLDEAISTIGGVSWSALDENFMLTGKPGVFCAGEMIDWDAPTGGYLLTACLATGRSAGLGLAKWLRAQL